MMHRKPFLESTAERKEEILVKGQHSSFLGEQNPMEFLGEWRGWGQVRKNVAPHLARSRMVLTQVKRH
jgi:hypothetical protein